MPTYDYVCPACGRRFEAQVTIARRDERQVCPQCGGSDARRQLTACAVRTGSGAGGSAGCAGCAGGSCSTCKS